MTPLHQRLGNVTLPIYRRNFAGKVRYEVRWHDGARTVRKGFSSRALAESYAHEILTSLANGASAFLRLTPRERDYAERLRDLLHQRGLTIEEHYFQVSERLKREPFEAAPAVLVADAVKRFLATKRAANRRLRTVRDLELRLGKFARSFTLPLGRLTPEMIAAWLDGLRIGPRTRNNYRAALTNFFASVGLRALVTVPKAKTRAAKAIWTPAEMRLLLEGANDRLLPVLILGGFCGLRTESEIERLRWEEVDIEHRVIHVSDENKTEEARLAPIPDNAADWLEPWNEARGPVTDFRSGRIGEALSRLAKRVGLGRWRHNALRHSFGTYRTAVTEDVAKVSLEMGNSPAEVMRSYRRPRTKQIGEEWFAIRRKTVANGILNLKFT
jgi:integrase